MTTRMKSAALAVVVLLSVPLALRAAPSAPAPTPSFVLQAYVTHEKLPSLASGSSIGIPQLRVFDGSGRLLRNFGTEFSAKTFDNELAAIVAHPVAPASETPALAGELRGVVDAEGRPVSVPKDAKIVFVEYWASFCAPCHVQFNDLVRFIKTHPRLEATIVHVAVEFPPSAGKAKG